MWSLSMKSAAIDQIDSTLWCVLFLIKDCHITEAHLRCPRTYNLLSCLWAREQLMSWWLG